MNFAEKFIKKNYDGTKLKCPLNEYLYPEPNFINGKIIYGFWIDGKGCIHGSRVPIVFKEILDIERKEFSKFQGLQINIPVKNQGSFINVLNEIYRKPQF